MKTFANISGDFSGAVSAAVITLPMSIGYGIVAYSPLGMDFAPAAALLGVYGAVLSCLVASLMGGTPIQINGPKAPLTLALGAVVAKLTLEAGGGGAIRVEPAVIVGLVAFTTCVAGASQIVFGALGLGSLVKYVPQPVIAGFMNGIAFLLIAKQFRPLMGLGSKTTFAAVWEQPGLIRPEALFAGALTILAVVLAKKHLKKWPASVVGLAAGTGMYYLATPFGAASSAGSVIGVIQHGLPAPDAFRQWAVPFQDGQLNGLLPDLFFAGLVLGLLGSLESLLSAVVADNLAGTRHNSRKELIGQGLANIGCALFGALPGAGSIPRTHANYRAGGRTRLSGVLCSLFIFAVMAFFGELIGRIPLAVIAGIIVMVGYSLFDRWSFQLIKAIFRDSENRREIFINLFMTAAVAIVTVSVNLIAAVVIGIVIASGLFISRVGKSIVRRRFSGEQIQSWRMRNREHSEFLERHGRKISVVELQGPLFFGSAEHLAHRIRRLTDEGADFVILDMKRVNAIDSTGSHILLRIKRSIESEKKFLLLSHLKENRTLWGYLASMNAARALEAGRIFPDTDSALEWAEDQLLDRLTPARAETEAVGLNQMEVLSGLAPAEARALQAELECLTFMKGEEILAEGERNRDLYFLRKGLVSAMINLPGRQCRKRLYTFSPGIVFGEIAFLDGGLRSASMWAHEDCEVLRLPFEQFQGIQARRPELAAGLITQIALVLGRRLRRISDQVRLLEDDEETECIDPGAEAPKTMRDWGPLDLPGPERESP